jgi:tetratricopeptide (TPR) repeat protein
MPLRAQVLPAEPLPPSKELDAKAHWERGLVYAQLRQYARAVEDINRANSLGPGRPPWEEAIRAFSQAIERHPEDAEAYHQRAHVHTRLSQWEKAFNDFAEALALAPQRLDLYVCRGRTYLRTGQRDKAAEDYRKAGQKPEQANRLARELATSPNLLHREPRLAVELAKQAVRQAPGEAMYWNTLGVTHYRLGEWEAAIQTLEEAEKRAPGTYLGFNAFFLTMCYQQLDDTARAKNYYDRAVRWCQENEGKLSTQQEQELRAFRAEAEALLKAAAKP